jgi:hypothetical protein
MKKYYSIILLFIFTVNISCNDKCEGIDCFTPPESFRFKVINKNGSNISDSKVFSLSYKDAQNTKLINLKSSTNSNGEIILYTDLISGVQYTLLSGGNSVGDLNYVNVKINENCCTYFKTTVLEFNGISLLGKMDKDYSYLVNIQ